MKYTLIRRIYFSSTQAGLVSKDVSKGFESSVPLMIGYELEDSAWSRRDEVKVESVTVDTDTSECSVWLSSLEVSDEEAVQRMYDVALSHGWAPLH